MSITCLKLPSSDKSWCAAHTHDDVIKWKHFLRYWPFVRGNHRGHKSQWRGALMLYLICLWINGWVRNLEAGDLRRYRTHYDVTVMLARAAMDRYPTPNPNRLLHAGRRSRRNLDRPHRQRIAIYRAYMVQVTEAAAELLVSLVRMMTSSNWNIFRVTGHLYGKFTGPRWIPRTMASDAELWCLLWSASE